MKSIVLILLSFVLSLSLMSGCNSNPRKDAEDLRYKAKAYGKLIRWKAYDEASAFIKLREGGEVVVNTELLNEIRVTKYEVISIIMNESRDEAVILADIAYYHERINSVHEIKDKQIWWKEEESGVWSLDGQLPPFIR
ncbi:MAG: hypothetical protein AB8C40_03530 [Gammaproteobacteria bacterium]